MERSVIDAGIYREAKRLKDEVIDLEARPQSRWSRRKNRRHETQSNSLDGVIQVQGIEGSAFGGSVVRC